MIRNSIIMSNTVIGENCTTDKAIIAEDVVIGNHVHIGVGEEAENVFKPKVYGFGIATIGEKSVVPDNVQIGKNTAISGVTEPADYPEGLLAGGGVIMKEDGEEA